MKLRNKRRIYVTLHHRGPLSLKEHRKLLNLASYDWGIMVSPKRSKGADSRAYSVSDSVAAGPTSRLSISSDGNVCGDWHFRSDVKDAAQDPRLIGKFLVGKLLIFPTYSAFEDIMTTLPMPELETGSCVTWTRDAIRLLQEKILVQTFEVDDLMTFMWKTANSWIDSGEIHPHEVDLTTMIKSERHAGHR